MREAAFRQLFDGVFSEILGQIESGTEPWQPPWLGGDGPRNHRTLRYYTGINELILQSAAHNFDFVHHKWLTANQVVSMGGAIKPGERGTVIVFGTKTVTRRTTPQSNRGFSRLYTVYNVGAQCYGISLPVPPRPSFRHRNARVEMLVRSAGLTVIRGGTAAYYSIETGYLHVPLQSTFYEPAAFYRTLLHEAAHGMMARLGLGFRHKHDGELRALTEMTAELASAVMCRALEITFSVRSADYIGEWLAILRSARKVVAVHPAWLFEVSENAKQIARALLAFDPGP